MTLKVNPNEYPSVKNEIISTQQNLYNEVHSEKWNDYIEALKDLVKLSESPAEWYIKYYHNASKKAFVKLAYDAYDAGQTGDVVHYGEKFYEEFVKENRTSDKKAKYFKNLDYIMLFVSAVAQTAYETKYINSTNNIIYDVIGKDNLDYLGISADDSPWAKAANRCQNMIGVSRTNIEAEATKYLTDKICWDVLIGSNVSTVIGVGMGTWTFGLAVSRVLLKAFPLTNKLIQEYKADLRSQLLSELQQNVYHVSQINLEKLESDWNNRELLKKYLRSLELYCRTSIAMYENLQTSMDRFDSKNLLSDKTQEQIDHLAVSLYKIITMEDDNLDKCLPMNLLSFETTRTGANDSSVQDNIDKQNSLRITDISQVVEMNLTAADAAKMLNLDYEINEDGELYFYKDSSCDEEQGILWCYDFQKDQKNNWKFSPGELEISIYGVVEGMKKEELISLMKNQQFTYTDYFGGEEEGDFNYEINKDELVIGGRIENDVVTHVSIFSAVDY